MAAKESSLSAADAAHRAWLTDLHAKAAATAEATTLGEPVFGWNDRCPAAACAPPPGTGGCG